MNYSRGARVTCQVSGAKWARIARSGRLLPLFCFCMRVDGAFLTGSYLFLAKIHAIVNINGSTVLEEECIMAKDKDKKKDKKEKKKKKDKDKK
ncbi:MAG: hypothetical protein ACYC3P_09135 [Bellilinea sp.]